MPSGLPDPQVIELLYQATLEPTLWTQALAALLPRFRSKHASVITRPATEEAAPFFAQHGFSDAELKLQFSSEAMRCLESLRLPFEKMLTNRHFISDEEWERSEAYNEYVRHSGVYHGAMYQQSTSDAAFFFSICRPGRSDPYTDEELADLRSIAAHLGHALHLQRKLNLATQHANALQAALDRLSDGALAVNAKGMPLFANARAQELLERGDGVSYGPAGIRTQQPALTQTLLDKIQVASDRRWTGDLHLSLPRRKPRLPLLLDILSLSPLTLATGGAGEAAALIFIREPDAPSRVNRQAIADTLRLTPREVDVAVALAEGAGAETIASKIGMTVGTVRFHIKRIFQKTGVRSQVALVLLIRGFTSLRR